MVPGNCWWREWWDWASTTRPIEHTTTVLHHCIGHRFISKTQIQSGEKWDQWTRMILTDRMDLINQDGPDYGPDWGRPVPVNCSKINQKMKYHNSLQNTKTLTLTLNVSTWEVVDRLTDWLLLDLIKTFFIFFSKKHLKHNRLIDHRRPGLRSDGR